MFIPLLAYVKNHQFLCSYLGACHSLPHICEIGGKKLMWEKELPCYYLATQFNWYCRCFFPKNCWEFPSVNVDPSLVCHLSRDHLRNKGEHWHTSLLPLENDDYLHLGTQMSNFSNNIFFICLSENRHWWCNVIWSTYTWINHITD